MGIRPFQDGNHTGSGRHMLNASDMSTVNRRWVVFGIGVSLFFISLFSYIPWVMFFKA